MAFSSLRDDLIRAIKKLKALGTGFGIIPVGGTYLIQSVPAELNMDHTVVLQLAEVPAAFWGPAGAGARPGRGLQTLGVAQTQVFR